MSDAPLGRYHFLSWARRGVATSIGNPDQGSLPGRASLDVQLTVTVRKNGANSDVLPAPMKVEMLGPGDVIGIDPRHVIRTEPRHDTENYEPNYLCGIEFDGPDYPWMFTPAAPKNDRLRPWVSLIVLKKGEFTPSKTPPNPLPSIAVQAMSALPELADSWNWAHVQVSGDASLSQAMASAPGTALSRLLCPRRLDPETAYFAFLVPAFETGRLAGLGLDVPAAAPSDAAWTKATTGPLLLPVYYQFQFHTSDAGDFESLVRRLTPRVLPEDVGKRMMDVSQPQQHIPSAGPPLGLEGALHSISTTSTPWNDPDKTAFQTKVQTFINQPSTLVDDPAKPAPDDPVIAPPIYGRWHAAVQGVDRNARGWVNDLNLDPRNRSGGGMGTQVVQGARTSLMSSAWQQVEGILKANQLLREAQLARATLEQLHAQHFQTATPETAMTLTAPLHARLMASPITILATVRASRVPERMVSPTFRRVARPRRRVATVGGLAPKLRAPLLARINSGELAFVPAPKPPDGMVSLEEISDTIATPADRRLTRRWKLSLALLVLFAILAALIALAALGPLVGAGAAAAVVAASFSAAAALYKKGTTAAGKVASSDALRASGFTPQAVAEIPPRPTFELVPPGARPTALEPRAPSGAADSPAAAGFRAATTELFAYVQALPTDAAPRPPLDLAALKSTLMRRLDPTSTVPRRALARISLPRSLKWTPSDVLEPIMAAPVFPQPMYVPLRDLSPQYVLPGVDRVPPETLGLLLVNHAFIESYMVGLNHEMARQLLWNDFPTDQRGSCFRQFWDVSAYVRQKTDPADPVALADLLKDIPPVHTWPKRVPLGGHPNRTDIVENNVVLLVRGELFKRYPNTIIYAVKAKRAGKTRVLDDNDERYPIFRGALPNDMTFLGFNLSLDDARGGTAAAPEGFFFAFQEQPSEPRFGLEPTEQSAPTKHWADLAWTNFGGGGGGGAIFKLPSQGQTARALTIEHSPHRLASQVFSMVISGTSVPDSLSPAKPPSRTTIVNDAENVNDENNKWGVNSAQTAYTLLRLPFRVLIHADLMIPSR